MDVLLVLALALAAGVSVYRLSLGWSERAPMDRRFSAGQGDPMATIATSPGSSSFPGYAYVPLASGRRSWQTRLLGVAGIVLMVSTAAALFALAVYQAVHLVNQTFVHFAGSPTPTVSP